jgi:hypothetical protein
MSAHVTHRPALSDNTRRTYRLVQETHYTDMEIAAVIAHLRVERLTGTLLIDLSQGGVNRVRFREEQDIHYEK